MGKRNHIPIFDIIANRLRESVAKNKDYEIAEQEEIEDVSHDMLLWGRGLSPEEHQKAQKLKHSLLKKFKGKKLEDVIVGSELVTKKGSCYHIKNLEKINLEIINPDKAKEKILSDLKLIHGIGETTERILKNKGYKTLEDLTRHPLFGSEAKKFLKIIDKCDTCRIIGWIEHWLPKSHPLVLCVSGLHRKEDYLFLDIETLGLFNRVIILFGVAQISGNDILINQYFLRNIREEPAALTGLLSHFRENTALVTFNGRTFDMPYIRERLAYYRMQWDLEKPHFDLLHFSRRAWRNSVPDCRLITLEKYLLRKKRKHHLPSALVPEFYETYMKTKNIGPLIPIIEHNKQDLVTLVNVFSKLHEKWG